MEKEISVELKNWFNQYDVEAWHNQGNYKFQVRGGMRRPDMIIFSKKLNQYIVLEIKVGDTAKDIHDAGKILDYYKDYLEKKAVYFIGNKEIKISSFAVCTFYSMFGMIFKEDVEPLGMKDANDHWAKVNMNYGFEPLWEYGRSRDYLRGLWSQWRRFRTPNTPGCGIILSDCLNRIDFVSSIEHPILFDQQYEANKWKVRQKRL